MQSVVSLRLGQDSAKTFDTGILFSFLISMPRGKSRDKMAEQSEDIN